MKGRYFLVSYVAHMVSREQFLGLSSVITEDSFINKKRFIKGIIDEGRDNAKFIKSVLITQILELTEQDYLDWYE